MATKEAVAQLATMPERVAVVETKVDAMIVCIDEIKSNVKDMHDCLDNTRDMLAEKLEKMQEEYRGSRAVLYLALPELRSPLMPGRPTMQRRQAIIAAIGAIVEIMSGKAKSETFVSTTMPVTRFSSTTPQPPSMPAPSPRSKTR